MAPYIQNTKVSLIFASLLLLVSLPSSTAQATEGMGVLSVSPLFTDISLSTTDTAKDFSLTVGNATAEPVVLRISLVDFGSLNESGGIAFLGKEGNGNNRYALASWIIPEKDVVTLLPGVAEKLKFTVENRESLSPGGHYAAALFSIEKEGGNTSPEGDGSSVAVNSTFSALIFAKKEGGIIQELTLKEHSIEAYDRLLGLPSKLALRFQNSGNVDLAPRGRITLSDPLGRLVAKGILNEDSSRILPESFRKYPVVLLGVVPSFIPGFYTLTAEYRFDGQDTAQIAFETRAFAWGVTAGWLVALGGSVWGGVLFKRFVNRRRNKQPVV